MYSQDSRRSRLAGLVLVVSVVLATMWQGNYALAAEGANTLYGSSDTIESEPFDVGPISFGARCQGNAYWVATRNNFGVPEGWVEYGITVSVACRTTLNSPGFDNNRNVILSGVEEGTTEQCVRQGKITASDKEGAASIAFKDKTGSPIVLGYMSDPGYDSEIEALPPPGIHAANVVCVPNEIQVNGASGTSWSAKLELGQRPLFGNPGNGETCEFGTPQTATISHETSNIYKRITIDFSPGMQGYWHFIGYVRDAQTGVIAPVTVTGSTAAAQAGQTSLTNRVSLGGQQVHELVGVQVWRSTDSSHLNSMPTPSGWKFRRGSPLPSGSDALGGHKDEAGKLYGPGLTHAPSCSFWIGQDQSAAWAGKVPPDLQAEPWSSAPPGDPNIGELEEPIEEPVAPEPVAPVEPEPACQFDLTDPGSWLEGGICALVGLLKMLVEAVIAIPAAIFALVEELLIPDPTTWGFDELQDQFRNRPPGSLMLGTLDGVQSGVQSYGGGNCALFEIKGEAVTCNGAHTGGAYQALYTLVQAGIVALTGLSIFRLFAGSFSDKAA